MRHIAKPLPLLQIIAIAAPILVFFHFARLAAGLPFIEERLPYWVIHLCSAAVIWPVMWRARAAYMSKSFASRAVVRWPMIALALVVLPFLLGSVANAQARWIGYGNVWQTAELQGTVSEIGHFRRFRKDFARVTITGLSSKKSETTIEWELAGASLTSPQPSWTSKTVCLTASRTLTGMHVRSLKLC